MSDETSSKSKEDKETMIEGGLMSRMMRWRRGVMGRRHESGENYREV